MPVYGAKKPKPMFSPVGDYAVEIIAVQDKGVSTGAKTQGCTTWNLQLEVMKTGSTLFDMLIESDNEFCARKLDCFLQSCDVKIKPGEGYSFDEDEARAN